ncbi:Serine/threonine-protein phosphatase 2A regulatory subunit B'' subunit alpha, partial [Haplosporangium sp. Z 27]
RSGTTALGDSPQGYTKSINSNNDEDSPLSPPLAWSREGTNEELSKYQELQMRQQNDGQHRPQGQGLTTLSDEKADKVDTNLVTKRSEKMRSSSSEGSSQEQTTSREKNGEKKTKSRGSPTSNSTKRTPKSSRTKVAAKTSEEGHHHHGLEVMKSSSKSDRVELSPNNSHCQKNSSLGSSAKTGCNCSSCQSERISTTPPQRSFRYGQFLGSGESMPIYAGPLGLGDDIPSPTPSPPPPGRLSIHMAMSGRSPLSSPSGSPLMTMTRSSIPISSPSSSTSAIKSPGRKTTKSIRKSSHEVLSGSDDRGASNSITNHPVITGFQSQARDTNIRSSKKSPSLTPTSHSYLEATPLSTSPSSPSSSPYSSSFTKSSFRPETEKDTSPSLSPFFMSTRSFSPEKQAFSPPSSFALSTSPPMRSDTLHAHNILQQSTSTSDSHLGFSNLKQQPDSIANSDFPRLAPPVVLVQSPTVESLVGHAESYSKATHSRYEDSGPLLYSSVLASSISSNPSSSPTSPINITSSSSRSSTQQSLSSRGQFGTPPLSPSRKRESGIHSTLSSLENKDFEAWSINEERVARTSTALQYKFALLSGGTKDKTHNKQQIQQPKVFSRHQSSANTHKQHDPSSSTSPSKQARAASPVEQNTSNQRWQTRGQTSSRETTDSTLKKVSVIPTSSSNNAKTEQGLDKLQDIQAAPKRPGNTGVSPHVLRRSRSAPTLASGHLSYADILKASIKSTSAPSLPASGNIPSSPVDSTLSSSNTTSSPSPLISSSSVSDITSFNASSSDTSAGNNGFKSKLVASLAPNRVMKSLRRSSLISSKSDNNLKSKIDRNNMSAPMRSLLSSLRAVESSDKAPDVISREFSEESPSEEEQGKKVELPKELDSDPGDVISTEVDLERTDLENSNMDLEQNDESSIHDASQNPSSGLSFFQPPEELEMSDVAEFSESIIAVSMTESAQSRNESSETDASLKSISSSTETGSEQMDEKFISRLSPILTSQESFSTDDEDEVTSSPEQGKDDLTPMVDQTEQHSDLLSQQQLALQELDDDESQQSKGSGGGGGGFKSRRKRISSSGGKKLLLKKKSSQQNIHSSLHELQTEQHKVETDGSNNDDSPVSSAKLSGSTDYVIPPFYFPMGKPVAATKRRQRVHSAVAKAKEIFVVSENGVLAEDSFVAITVQCCELPRYMNRALFRKVDVAGIGGVKFAEFERVWESLVETCPDEISMIFTILKQPNVNVLTPSDFEVVLQDLVLFHPGLEFLSGNVVFQERYLETVITRIFYDANRRHGRMSLSDLRKSNFDKTLRKLENSDLNQTEDCFSYKHFYVIYCKFWELDQDHDLVLDEQDLACYSGGAISSRIIRRVMQGYGNETGMFIVPDQDLLLQQQQQQISLMQQQQLIEEQTLQREQSAEGDITQAENDFEMEVVDLDDGAPSTLKRSESMTLNLADVLSEVKGEAANEPSPTLENISSPLLPCEMTSPAITSPMLSSPQRTTPPGPGSQRRPQNYRMTYKGFIWFLLAETDKQTPTSIEYWFRCMDLDGDGVLSVFELEQLFQEQASRMAILSMESFVFRDAICQMQDLVGPKETGLVRLSDLKQCGQAGPFIDLFCNVVKWRSFEAHQHQIRMRQQQTAMQRAADAAWEEAAAGEDLFDGGDFDFDLEDLDDDDEDYLDDDEDDDDEEGMEGLDDDEEPGNIIAELEDDELLSRTDSEGSPSSINSVSEDSTITMTQSNDSSTFVGLGLGVAITENSEEKNNVNKLTYQSPEHRGDQIASTASVVSSNVDMEGRILEGTFDSNNASVKDALKRKRAKERRRKQRQFMMKRALLVEQRKEKALLASIRESPWIVYVEVEYEKLVTIERPQSRTGWEQDEEDEEEEEEEMDDEDVEIMDEDDMMMEEGREPTIAEQHFQLQQLQLQQQQLQQQLQLQYQIRLQQQQQQIQQQMHQQNMQRQFHQHGGAMAHGQADVIDTRLLMEMDQGGQAGMMVTSFDESQEFEQILIDPHVYEGNEQTTAAVAAIAAAKAAAAKTAGAAIHL